MFARGETFEMKRDVTAPSGPRTTISVMEQSAALLAPAHTDHTPVLFGMRCSFGVDRDVQRLPPCGKVCKPQTATAARRLPWIVSMCLPWVQLQRLLEFL